MKIIIISRKQYGISRRSCDVFFCIESFAEVANKDLSKEEKNRKRQSTKNTFMVDDDEPHYHSLTERFLGYACCCNMDSRGNWVLLNLTVSFPFLQNLKEKKRIRKWTISSHRQIQILKLCIYVVAIYFFLKDMQLRII